MVSIFKLSKFYTVNCTWQTVYGTYMYYFFKHGNESNNFVFIFPHKNYVIYVKKFIEFRHSCVLALWQNS